MTPSHTEAPPEERGKTYIEDDVVSIIARAAAADVGGVHSIGSSSIRTWFPQLGRHHGVDAEVGMKEAAVDVEIVAEFGHPIRDVAAQLRRAIVDGVEMMTGRSVVEVNVYVVDVNVPKLERKHRRQLE